MTVDKVRCPAVTEQQLFQFLAADPIEDRRIRDFVPVEVKDRQNRAVRDWVQEFIRVPGCRQRPGFGLAIADHAGNDEVRVVEYRAERMTQRITQFAALVNRSRALWRCVTRDSAGKG